MSPSPRIILASTSPRRRELLAQLAIPFEAVDVEVDETPRLGEPAEVYVARVAAEKSLQGQCEGAAALPVLGADTEVVLDGEVLGKPRDREHGEAMLKRLAGREHRVLSGVSLRFGEQHWQAMSESRVYFRALRDAEISAYWNTGEPADKAGAYAIQGLGAVFIARLEGSFSGVMGLPVYETAELLSRVGIDVFGESQCRDER
nr:nucleoside triphosphate pyrophosphatase [Methyloterricola oryzae]